MKTISLIGVFLSLILAITCAYLIAETEKKNDDKMRKHFEHTLIISLILTALFLFIILL